MNASRSIFTAPSSFNSQEDSKAQSRRPVKRPRSSSTQPPTLHSLARAESFRPTRLSLPHIEAPYPSAWKPSKPPSLLNSTTPSLSDDLTLSKQLSSLRTGQPPQKRPCHQPQTRHNARVEEDQPPPLFFSDSPRSRPSFPLRLSNAQLEANMMGKGDKEETGKVKTVKIARASPKVSSPGAQRPRPYRNPSGQGSSGAISKAKASEEETRSNGHTILQQVGISEVLDQDDRPTFIIDLGHHANLEPGPLKAIFFNTALKSSPRLMELVTGHLSITSPGFSTTTAFNEFKAWVTSYVKNNQALDVPLPSFSYAGATWVCSTLRKQLRLIRGVLSGSSAMLNSGSPSLGKSAAKHFFPSDDRRSGTFLSILALTRCHLILRLFALKQQC